MSMAESLSQWLEKKDIKFKPSESYTLCRDILKQEGENLDACINLAYAYETDAIDEKTFLSGLCQVTGYDVDKLWRVIRGEADAQQEETTQRTQPESTADIERVGAVLSKASHPSGDVEPTSDTCRAGS